MSRIRTRIFVALVAAAALAPVAMGATAGADAGGAPNPNADFGQDHKRVCPPGGPQTEAACHAEVVTKADKATPLATTSYTNGYRPADLASAYNYSLPVSGSPWTWNGKTIAIVDAYDLPTAASDLATYRSQFGLPPCTTGNGCFSKIDQNGGTAYPAANTGWGQEIALDIEMASAVCPNCKILLVEANSSSFTNLFTAVDRAASVVGVKAISNSYGGNEFSSEAAYESHYNHPGIAITVSSGDSGYGAEFPAASQYVTAVGGTNLKPSSSTRGWTETAWSGAGSGCSRYISKPTWQKDAGCARRTVADVSAVADPATGVAVYDSSGSSGGANWYVFGGTSVASPIVAGFFALAGNFGTVSASYPYNNRTALYDVTSGSNGRCRSTPYLCTAGAGYDGPTGLGTPNGTGSF